MLSYRQLRTALAACIITAVILGFEGYARAQEQTTVGAACTTGQDRADWDAIFQCVSSAWQRGFLIFGDDPNYSDSASTCSQAGEVRWNATNQYLQYCDGTNWHIATGTSTSCGSPSGLSFTNVTGATLSTVYSSNTATITFSGCSSALSVSVSGGGSPQISVNGGTWTTSGSIYSGQTLQVRLTSSSAASTLLTATVTVGSSSTNWTVTTAASDPCAVTSPSIGTVCQDGSIYAGISPNGNVKMFAAPCDYGMTGSAGSCTGTRGSLKWGSGTSEAEMASEPTSQSAGNTNTSTLYGLSSDVNYPFPAADYCYNLSSYLGHSDWYLPAVGELEVLYENLSAITGFTTGGSAYWSSTDYGNAGGADDAYQVNFSTGVEGGTGATATEAVRCVRL